MCSKPIFCSKIALKGKTCSRLLKPQKVAPNAKSCSKVAEHNRDRPSHYNQCFCFLHLPSIRGRGGGGGGGYNVVTHIRFLLVWQSSQIIIAGTVRSSPPPVGAWLQYINQSSSVSLTSETISDSAECYAGLTNEG